jgi:hypothetical protein
MIIDRSIPVLAKNTHFWLTIVLKKDFLSEGLLDYFRYVLR